ncbi:MAG TPA: hypothetical protein VJB06_01050, partial [archaeon]|nr:hypothetical protein [archaeon]
SSDFIETTDIIHNDFVSGQRNEAACNGVRVKIPVKIAKTSDPSGNFLAFAYVSPSETGVSKLEYIQVKNKEIPVENPEDIGYSRYTTDGFFDVVSRSKSDASNAIFRVEVFTIPENFKDLDYAVFACGIEDEAGNIKSDGIKTFLMRPRDSLTQQADWIPISETSRKIQDSGRISRGSFREHLTYPQLTVKDEIGDILWFNGSYTAHWLGLENMETTQTFYVDLSRMREESFDGIRLDIPISKDGNFYYLAHLGVSGNKFFPIDGSLPLGKKRT